jgi:signal recognition particle receptor subunit alpha
VKAAIEEALVKVLTPKRQVDILRDVMALRQGPSPRPYSIVFVGVNGVGKSTNLAKVPILPSDVSCLRSICS